MAVFVGNSDESGVADLRGHYLVGGLIGCESNWPYLDRAWQERVLDGPPRIPYLHMREVRNRDGNNNMACRFAMWSDGLTKPWIFSEVPGFSPQSFR